MFAMWTTRGGRRAETVLADSVTRLGPESRDAVLVAGSHGGRYAAVLVVRAGARACVLNDAGIGLRRAGVAGLELLAQCAIPAVAADHETARIGDAADTLARGIVSTCNAPARALGCRPGLPVADAVELLAAAPARRADGGDAALPQIAEARHLLAPGEPPVWALDSASLVTPSDAGAILMLGSHGGLLGGDPAAALRVDARAAVFNDAGDAPDGPGTTRLPALDARGIAAATVAAATAAIGDGRSTFEEGVLSAVNETAARAGAAVGMPARDFARQLREHGDLRRGNQH